MAQVANPNMLTIVRDAKGWSQATLSTEAGLSQGYISKVESGKVDLRGSSLAAVAQALNCPISLLTRNQPGETLTPVHNRRRVSGLTVGSRKRIDAFAHLTRISVSGAIYNLEFRGERSLTRAASNQEAPAAAEELRRSWAVPRGPIGNVTSLIESAGVIVVLRPFGTTHQDAVSSWPDDLRASPLIVVNTGLSADRLRFTLAHELGHLVMHRIPTETAEQEANAFASAFLAPADDILPDLEGLTSRDFGRLLTLKEKWGLSVAALMRRALDLHVIDDTVYRSMNIELSRLGWRRSEPGHVPTEQPRLLSKAIEAQLASGVSVADISSYAEMTVDAFTRHFLPPVARAAGPSLNLEDLDE